MPCSCSGPVCPCTPPWGLGAVALLQPTPRPPVRPIVSWGPRPGAPAPVLRPADPLHPGAGQPVGPDNPWGAPIWWPNDRPFYPGGVWGSEPGAPLLPTPVVPAFPIRRPRATPPAPPPTPLIPIDPTVPVTAEWVVWRKNRPNDTDGYYVRRCKHYVQRFMEASSDLGNFNAGAIDAINSLANEIRQMRKDNPNCHCAWDNLLKSLDDLKKRIEADEKQRQDNVDKVGKIDCDSGADSQAAIRDLPNPDPSLNGDFIKTMLFVRQYLDECCPKNKRRGGGGAPFNS